MRNLWFNLLIIEVIAFVAMVLIIVIHRIYYSYADKRRREDRLKIQRRLTDIYKAPEKERTSFFEPNENLNMSKLKMLLKEMESFNNRFNGSEWVKLKREISGDYLLPVARKKVNSRLWEERNFAARVFALTPLSEDEKYISTLMNDEYYLVRSPASKAAVELESEHNVHSILKYLVHLPKSFASYFYRDMLIQASPKVHGMIESYGKVAKDSNVHLAILKALGNRISHAPPEFVKEDIKSSNDKIRLAALQVMSHYPNPETEEILIRMMDDPNAEIRLEATRGLAYYANDKSFEKLNDALNDKAWAVRLQAAKNLRYMGKRGLDTLAQQKPENVNAYSVSQDVLSTV